MRDINLIVEVKVVQLKNKNTVNRQPFGNRFSRNKSTRPGVLKIKSR